MYSRSFLPHPLPSMLRSRKPESPRKPECRNTSRVPAGSAMQRPRYRGRVLAHLSARPRIHEPRGAFDLEHLAVHDAVEPGCRLRSKSKASARHGCELFRFHEPAREHRRVGERSPHALGRMRITNLTGDVFHALASESRTSPRRASRSSQNASYWLIHVWISRSAFALKSIDPLTPARVSATNPADSKHAEVLRDGGACDAKRVRELVNGLLALAEQLEQSTAGWISEGAEHRSTAASARRRVDCLRRRRIRCT